jgi:hypothetical protein
LPVGPKRRRPTDDVDAATTVVSTAEDGCDTTGVDAMGIGSFAADVAGFLAIAEGLSPLRGVGGHRPATG